MIITSEHKEHYKIEDISKHIKAGNSVITKEFNWEKEFPEVFEQGGFDIVIGNPPYVKHELIIALKEDLKEEYKVYQGRGDLYIYFFEKAIKLLKENGIMGFICSNTYTNAAFGKKLRALMLENTILKYTDHTGEKLFNATVDTSSIFIQKTKPSKDHKILIDNKHNIKQKTVTEEGFYFDEQTIKLKQIPIRPKTNRFEEICFMNRGLQLQSKKNGEFKKDDLISKEKDNIHSMEYIEAKNTEPYNIKEIKYVEYNTERVPSKINNPTFIEQYTVQEKTIINRVGKIRAVYDNNQMLTNDSLISCILWKDLKGINNNNIGNIKNREELENISCEYNQKYITAFVNSKLARILINREKGIGNTIPIKITKELPIAKADKETQNKIAEQVDIMMDKNASNNAKANAEATINKTIYEIYQLTKEEINIIEGNLK